MEKFFFKKEITRFLVLFLVLYLVVFVVLNVTGWLVRPKALGNNSEATIYQNNNQSDEEKIVVTEEPSCVFSDKTDSIFIPGIGIEAPIIFPQNADEKVLRDSLNKGAVHYYQSSLPGEEGRVILWGHSAPIGWPKVRYDWIFSDLNKLEEGDEIFLFYRNCQYSYQVSRKYFLDKGEDLPDTALTNSEKMLVLISCWPPGKDLKRIGVEARITNFIK